jgi:hypothetical protein
LAARCIYRNTGAVEHMIRFGDGPEDALIATSGTATMVGLDAVVTDLLSDDRYMPAMALLFDHTQLELDGLRAEDIVRRLHMPLKSADMIGPRRIAVVVSDLRSAEMRALRHDEPKWRAFTSLDDGRAWLSAA